MPFQLRVPNAVLQRLKSSPEQQPREVEGGKADQIDEAEPSPPMQEFIFPARFLFVVLPHAAPVRNLNQANRGVVKNAASSQTLTWAQVRRGRTR